MSMKDQDYLVRRRDAERMMANTATSRKIGEIHLQLARAYDARLSDVGTTTGSPSAIASDRRRAGKAV